MTCWASRKFALGGVMGIYKPLNYDATMLIRLTTEMKDAFFAGCKARGVVPSEEARRLIVAQVLEQWGLTQTQKTSLWSVVKTRWRCFQLSQLMK